MGRINRRPSGWRRERRQGGTACIPSLPGCWLAVAFSTKVARAMASGSWLCPFRHRGGHGSSAAVIPGMLFPMLCWLPLNAPLHLTVPLLSSPPVPPSECAVHVGVWWIQVMRAPMWRSEGLGCGEDLSQVTCVSLGKWLLLSGLSFFICEMRIMVRSSLS